MLKYGKWLVILLIVTTVATAALPVLAQDEGAGPDTFAGRPTLWVAIVIGFAATAATTLYAYQLKGGVVGTALSFISGGMFLVVLGFLAVVVSWASAGTQALVHDVLFIIGYVLILVGALRLRQMIR
jgi:hypothetical protein